MLSERLEARLDPKNASSLSRFGVMKHLGVLEEFMVLPNVFEVFYAITVRRSFVPAVLADLLSSAQDLDESPG